LLNLSAIQQLRSLFDLKGWERWPPAQVRLLASLEHRETVRDRLVPVGWEFVFFFCLLLNF
jgi:hypothetical protein